MSKRIRIFTMIWGTGVDDYNAIGLPSILQPENLPWLATHGFDVHWDFFTVEADGPRVGQLMGAIENAVRRQYPSAVYTQALNVHPGPQPSSDDLKAMFFTEAMNRAVESGARLIPSLGDLFYGNGSLRNIAVYGLKPGVVVSGPYLRVRRSAFLPLLAEHERVTGTTVVSNARLVDMALDSLLPSLQASFADDDRNASFHTACSLRRLSESVYTMTQHLPSPILYQLEPRDILFFRQQGRFEVLDHVWPTLLIAQNRWRVLASSDAFFLAEVTPDDVASDIHTYPLDRGMLYNDEFMLESLHGRYHQSFVVTLRRESLPALA